MAKEEQNFSNTGSFKTEDNRSELGNKPIDLSKENETCHFYGYNQHSFQFSIVAFKIFIILYNFWERNTDGDTFYNHCSVKVLAQRKEYMSFSYGALYKQSFSDFIYRLPCLSYSIVIRTPLYT